MSSTPRRATRESTQSLTRAVSLAQAQGNTRADTQTYRRSSSSNKSSPSRSSSAKKSSSTKKSSVSRRNTRSPARSGDESPRSDRRNNSKSERRRTRSPDGTQSNTETGDDHAKGLASKCSTFLSSLLPEDDGSEEDATPATKKRVPDTYAKVMEEADLGRKQLGFHNDQYIEDVSVEFLYKPHSVTALIILIGALVFLAFRLETSTDMVQNLRYGAGAACLFILILGLLIFPAGPFIRPHPLVWRFAFGLAVIYEIWLILLLFQTKESARMSMKFFDSSLGVPVEERSYAADCSFNWTTIRGAVDMFVISHFVGWVVKALILRDMVICWVISIQWELIEILFMHMLPNFAECWWDQWILDVALANGLGIYIGCKLAKYLEMKEYHWGRYQSIDTYLGKAKRTIMQFTPSSWTKVQWRSTSSINRLIGVQILILAMHLEELNAFFLKYILWVPPECKLNLIRLIIWAFVGVPSLRQIYSYMTDPSCKRIGHQTFLGLVILSTELIVIFKFGRGEFPHPMPEERKWWTGAMFAAYFVGLVFLALRTKTADHNNNKTVKKQQ